MDNETLIGFFNSVTASKLRTIYAYLRDYVATSKCIAPNVYQNELERDLKQINWTIYHTKVGGKGVQMVMMALWDAKYYCRHAGQDEQMIVDYVKQLS
jgi:hypothetical protein